jgi:hypothetical protein
VTYRVARYFLLIIVGGLAGGCGTRTVTVTKTVTTAKVSTVVERVATPREAVFFPALDGELVYRPSVIAMSDTGGLTKVRWSTYGKAVARGRGSYPISDCEPTCALAKPDWFTAKIELSRPRPCRGFRAYTRIRIDGVGIKYDARPYPLAYVIKGTPPC